MKIIKFGYGISRRQLCWLHGFTVLSFHTKEKAGKSNRIAEGSDCGCSAHHVTRLLFPRLWRGGPCIMGLALRCSPRHQAWSLGSESRQGWRKCAPCCIITAPQLSTPEATGAINVFLNPAPTKIITHWKTACFSFHTLTLQHFICTLCFYYHWKVLLCTNASTQFRQTSYSYWHLYAFE